MARTHDSERTGPARRALIITTALRLFAERGYRGTSLAAVAEAAGITQSGLLHHFPSKEALLAAVLDERDRQAFDALEITKAFEGPATIRALDIVNEMIAHSSRNRELTRLGHLGTTAASELPESARTWARENIATFQRNLAAVIRNDIAAKHVRRNANPEATAALIIATITGIEQQWLLDEAFDMVTAIELFTGLLRRDLLAH